MKDNLRIGFAVLYQLMACQGCLFVVLFRAYTFHPQEAADCSRIYYHIYHRDVYYRNVFECVLLRANLFELVRELSLKHFDIRSLSTQNQCINSPSLAVFFPSIVCNIVADLMSIAPSYQADKVFILPFFLVRTLRISRRQYWGLVSIFGLGGIAIVISISRVIALAFSATTTQVAVWTALECAMAIIVACCPALRLLFRRSGGIETNSSMENEQSYHRRPKGRTGVIPKAMGVWSSVYAEGTTDIELIAEANGRVIFKNVDFEIMSERGSQTLRPMKLRTESWEDLDSKAAHV
jgi:hypothetical protein